MLPHDIPHPLFGAHARPYVGAMDQIPGIEVPLMGYCCTGGLVPSKRRATILLSGGADSVVLAYDLHSQGYELDALHFRFWPRHGRRALAMAKKVAKDIGANFKLVDLRGVAHLMCSLVPGARLSADELDTGPDECNNANEDATTPTPSGMVVLPAIAAFYAQAAQNREAKADVFLGVIKNQLDRNPGLLDLLNGLPPIVTGLNRQLPAVTLRAPYDELTKVEVLRRGAELGVPLKDTWSCLDVSRRIACGVCAQCFERKTSFEEAGMRDETRYAA